MEENPRYLTDQLITYLGNKRALLPFIGDGLSRVRARLGTRRLDCLDVFSGSGIVARYLKRHSARLTVNDLEPYAEIINRCYLTNRGDFDRDAFEAVRERIVATLAEEPLDCGFISRLYAPADDGSIQPGERAFYTTRNARYLDTARRLIEELPPDEARWRDYLIAPLLAEASVHANTSGVFKGFYKNSATGIGQFGGRKGDALSRIRGDIGLPAPILSEFDCECRVLRGDANALARDFGPHDVAYVDPPYNQHPYGSNYFMLNLIAAYREPGAVSPVSGIPDDWNRSAYNRRVAAAASLESLVAALDAKFLLVSFNSEGFIPKDEMVALLARHGRLETLDVRYNAFRGSRNLSGRDLHVTEFLFILEKG